MTINESDRNLLSRYVSNLEDDIYCLRNLPPEVVAVLFAYVSRSPNSFRENLLNLLKAGEIEITDKVGQSSELPDANEFATANKKARQFHKKWVIGYGHASVAEHADIKFALENVSIIASKIIEDCRLASYTEKSTRYQVFSPPRYYKGEEIVKSPVGEDYIKTVEMLFAEYNALQTDAMNWLKSVNERESGIPEIAYETSVKAGACDIARYLLPAATLTSIGVSTNAREATWAITKFLSAPIKEINRIGARMREEGGKIAPTLLKYAEKSPYIERTDKNTEALAKNLHRTATFERWNEQKPSNTLVISDYDPKGEDKIIAALLYRRLNEPFEILLKKVSGWNDSLKRSFLDEALSNIGAYDTPPRELELATVTCDILIDFGAFRDIQRHRIATQIPQEETVAHGYESPPELAEFGWEARFKTAMERARETFYKMEKETPLYARYVVPLAFRKRALISWNLRELFHFIRLRSSPQGHISYRRLAWSLYDEIVRIYPLLASYFLCDKTAAPLGRLASEIKRANNKL
ncbi:MAG: FAD-dependent thymidylate synthase [Myxococcota bacterium]